MVIEKNRAGWAGDWKGCEACALEGWLKRVGKTMLTVSPAQRKMWHESKLAFTIIRAPPVHVYSSLHMTLTATSSAALNDHQVN